MSEGLSPRRRSMDERQLQLAHELAGARLQHALFVHEVQNGARPTVSLDLKMFAILIGRHKGTYRGRDSRPLDFGLAAELMTHFAAVDRDPALVPGWRVIVDRDGSKPRIRATRTETAARGSIAAPA